MRLSGLVMRLENLFVEGASLEPTLLERIRRNVDRFEEMSKKIPTRFIFGGMI